MPTIEFFEIPASDMARARQFYRELFQWEFEPFADDQYALIRTEGRYGQPGIHGGMTLRKSAEQPITNYITVDSIDAYVARVRDLGGQIVLPRTAVATVGWMCWCRDTEGNLFALWQDDPAAR